MKDYIKLSIIMPLYNVENTVSLALDSVLMQDVDFDYEIIAVDDGSTDSTLKIIKQYSKKSHRIKIITHEKNQGNAISFYDGLCAAKGDYFCVLDGDDYYTIRSKLKMQVEFLDSDIDEKYTAVVHGYLTSDNSGLLRDNLYSQIKDPEYDYFDFLQGKFYYHTTSYMYRNIFKNNVPECFRDEWYRGDSPRTFMHLMHTKGKVKVLKFIGSVYCFNKEGIWSGMPFSKRTQRNIDMYTKFMEKMETAEEKELTKAHIKRLENCKTKEDPMFSQVWSTKKDLLTKFRNLKKDKTVEDFYFKSLKNSIKFMDFVHDSEYYAGKYKKCIKRKSYNFISKMFSVKDSRKFKIIKIAGITIKIKNKKGVSKECK